MCQAWPGAHKWTKQSPPPQEAHRDIDKTKSVIIQCDKSVLRIGTGQGIMGAHRGAPKKNL